MKKRRSFREHLAHIVPDENGCWLWTGGIESNGYGRTTYEGKAWWVHRLSYEVHKGPIPEGHLVCHACDVRSCINPDHLFTGSIADNQRDMKLKGRASRGERSASAKLTEADVRRIREDTRPGWQLAVAYGVSQATISEVRSKKVWAHVI